MLSRTNKTPIICLKLDELLNVLNVGSREDIMQKIEKLIGSKGS